MMKRKKMTGIMAQDHVIVGITALFIIAILAIYFFLSRIAESFQTEDPKLHHIRCQMKKIRPETVEQITLLEDQRSYTINKKKIYMCLRDQNGEYYDDNMLLFVALHELAHVLCDEIGHTAKFNRIFQELLDEAASEGIYDPNIEPIQNYCEY